MKKFILMTIVLTLIKSTCIQAQNDSNTNDYPFIEVTGKSEIEVVPDEITIAIKIKERYKNKEKITIRQQEDSLKYYIVKEELDLTKLTLSNANSDLVQVNWSKRQIITETNYRFLASTAEEVAKIFQIVEKFMLYDAYILKVDHSKIEELKSEVRIKAIKNAKEKADQMLTAIGSQTGKPRIIQETTPSPVYRETYQSLATKEISSVAATTSGVYQNPGRGADYQYESHLRTETPVDPYSLIANRTNLTFSKIKIFCSVYVKFEIK